MEQYKILKDLISFNTIKDKENKEIINYIEEYLINLGFITEYESYNKLIEQYKQLIIEFCK